MHRIDHSTNNASLPAPDAAGTPGYFKKGDPGLGILATVVTQDWANAVQEELAYVILQAGLVLSKTDNTQLHQAIQNMIQSANSAVIITGATFEASVANGEAVRWDSTNSRFDEAIADGTANNQAAGFADVTNGKVYCYGKTPALFAGLTPGARYYLSAATAGAITAAAPVDKILMGVAESATTMFVDVDPAATAALPIYALLEDQKPTTTGGGTFTSGAVRDRNLNTKAYDPAAIVSLNTATGAFTLQAGTYLIEWEAPAHRVDNHQSLLYNVTTSSPVKQGSSEFNAATDATQTSSKGCYGVTLSQSTEYKIQHQCATTYANDGFGRPAGLGGEVYTQVKITKI